MTKYVIPPCIALALAVAILAPAPVASQQSQVSLPAGPKVAVPAGWKLPRTPWGDPDIQGNLTSLYEFGTPMERPAQFEGRRLQDITGEELAAMRREQQKTLVDRRLAATGVQGGTPEVFLDAYKHDRAIVAWFVVDPPEGKIPPLTAAAQGRRREGRGFHGPADSFEDFSLFNRCVSRGYPESMMPTAYGNSYEIVQTPGYVAIRYEMIHETRIIPLDGRERLNPEIRLWMGDARGRWEGDTLVVETRNFRPDMTPRNANPDTLRIIERFRRVSPDKIFWYVTYDDPQTWTRPWTYMVPLTMTDEEPIEEYACHEANYALWDELTGQRTQDAKAAAGGSGR